MSVGKLPSLTLEHMIEPWSDEQIEAHNRKVSQGGYYGGHFWFSEKAYLDFRYKEVIRSMSDSPLEHITREEFAELFNKKKLITHEMIKSDRVNAYNEIERRRNKMLRTIAKIRTTVHAMDEAMREEEKNASTAEKKRIAEISKRYVSPKAADSAPRVKKDSVDSMIEMFGSAEAAEAYLKSLLKK